MLIFACPGQGSQTKGFLTSWMEHLPSLEERLKQYSEYCGRDLVQLGTTAEEETIRETANAQRLIVGASLAIYREAFADQKLDGALGHSVGEIAAAAIAGVISDQQALQLVGVRADAMAKAAALTPTSMAAVIGGDEQAVLTAIADCGLQPANFNGAGQIVAAGGKDEISKLIASPPEKARVIELKVAGAFHTSFMQSAVESVAEFASGIRAQNPTCKLWSNSAGQLVTSGAEFLNLLVDQIARPVRWDLCMASINQDGNTVAELPPAGALSGLLKRGADKVHAVAIKELQDIEKVSQ